MVTLLELNDKRHRLRIAPELGGGIADAVALTDDGPVPILRPFAGGGAFDIGCNLLAPFSNRIGGNSFRFVDCHHWMQPNVDGEPLVLHGDAWLAEWSVIASGTDRVTLSHQGACGPYRYGATVTYRLTEQGIGVALEIVNEGPRLPFGGGFHPWFPRLAGTQIGFAATGLWTETAEHLPDRHLHLEENPDWCFTPARPPPRTWINVAYTGVVGSIRLDQPDLGIAVALFPEPALDTCILFSPGAHADFICVEPVSHPVDAHNLPGRPGLRTLDLGETLSLITTIAWAPLN